MRWCGAVYMLEVLFRETTNIHHQLTAFGIRLFDDTHAQHPFRHDVLVGSTVRRAVRALLFVLLLVRRLLVVSLFRRLLDLDRRACHSLGQAWWFSNRRHRWISWFDRLNSKANSLKIQTNSSGTHEMNAEHEQKQNHMVWGATGGVRSNHQLSICTLGRQEEKIEHYNKPFRSLCNLRFP